MKKENYFLILQVAMLAGELMMEANAETTRVEDTLNRILALSLTKHHDAYATTTGLSACLVDDCNQQTFSEVRRISKRNTNLSQIDAINQISRRLCSQQIDFNQAKNALILLKQNKQSSFKITLIGTIGISICFMLLITNCWQKDLVGVLFVCFGLLLWHFINKKNFLNDFLFCFGGGFCSGLMATLAKMLVGCNIDVVIIATIMPLLPGTIMTNSIRDIFLGDYMSGGAKAIEAIVKVAAISLGVLLSYGGGLWLIS